MSKSCSYSRRDLHWADKVYHEGDIVQFGVNGPEYRVFTVIDFKTDKELWLYPKDYQFNRATSNENLVTVRESAYYDAIRQQEVDENPDSRARDNTSPSHQCIPGQGQVPSCLEYRDSK